MVGGVSRTRGLIQSAVCTAPTRRVASRAGGLRPNRAGGLLGGWSWAPDARTEPGRGCLPAETTTTRSQVS